MPTVNLEFHGQITKYGRSLGVCALGLTLVACGADSPRDTEVLAGDLSTQRGGWKGATVCQILPPVVELGEVYTVAVSGIPSNTPTRVILRAPDFERAFEASSTSDGTFSLERRASAVGAGSAEVFLGRPNGTFRLADNCSFEVIATRTCGDDSCDPDEDCTSCPGDCGACPTVCGDDVCQTEESCETCEVDCGTCPSSAYDDDTYQTDTNAPREKLASRFDYAGYLADGRVNAGAYDDYDYTSSSSGRYVLDIIGAHFLVDNNDEPDEPTQQRDNSGSGDPDPCEDGGYPTNRYPFTVRQPNVTVVGGVIHGYLPASSPHVGIPQTADWDWAYCNSAALLFHGVDNGHADGIRITSAWDAIRVGRNFTVENSWLSHVRDDMLENDHFHSGVFADNLVDGTFQAFSSHDGSGGGASETVVASGNVLRIWPYPYKVWRDGKDQRFGALVKASEVTPQLVLRNNVIAIDPDAFAPGGSTYTYSRQWENTWANVDAEQCSNNAFLWMPSGIGGNESDLRDAYDDVVRAMPTQCFSIIETDPAIARELWLRAKQNWIDCHPKVGRMGDDPISDPSRCQSDTWGGFGN